MSRQVALIIAPRARAKASLPGVNNRNNMDLYRIAALPRPQDMRGNHAKGKENQT
jgi:hypothetical protein